MKTRTSVNAKNDILSCNVESIRIQKPMQAGRSVRLKQYSGSFRQSFPKKNEWIVSFSVTWTHCINRRRVGYLTLSYSNIRVTTTPNQKKLALFCEHDSDDTLWGHSLITSRLREGRGSVQCDTLWQGGGRGLVDAYIRMGKKIISTVLLA